MVNSPTTRQYWLALALPQLAMPPAAGVSWNCPCA